MLRAKLSIAFVIFLLLTMSVGVAGMIVPVSATVTEELTMNSSQTYGGTIIKTNSYIYNILDDKSASIKKYIGSECAIQIPSRINNYDVIRIEKDAFENNNAITSITIPSSVVSIEDYAFFSCGSLESVTLPNNLTYLGEGVFRNCTNLTSIKLPETLTEISDSLFYLCESLETIQLSSNIVAIGEHSFYGCRSMRDIALPAGITSIGSHAFTNCSNLMSIIIPENAVLELSDEILYTFQGCYKLAGIYTSENSPYYSSIDGVLYNKDMTSLVFYPSGKSNTEYTIPSTVLSVNGNSIYGSRIEKIVIPKNIVSIASSAFEYCLALTEISVADDNSFYSDINGILFDKTNDALLCYPSGRTESSYSIPLQTRNIGDSAFYQSNLDNIVIHKNIVSIGEQAFYNCELKNITFEEGVSSIHKWAFGNCYSLENITLPNSVTFLGSSAFNNCSSLKYVILPDNLTSIEPSTFSSCYSLLEITIPESVTSIKAGAFEGCESLKSITIPQNVVSINDESIEVDEDGVGILHYGVFENCSNLEHIYFLGDFPQTWTAGAWGHKIFGNTPETLTLYYRSNASGWCYPTWISPDNTVHKTCPFQPLPFELAKGDLDNDDIISQIDVDSYLQYFAGYDVPELDSKTADVNGDGKVTRVDAMIVVRYLDNWKGYSEYFKKFY